MLVAYLVGNNPSQVAFTVAVMFGLSVVAWLCLAGIFGRWCTMTTREIWAVMLAGALGLTIGITSGVYAGRKMVYAEITQSLRSAK